MLERRELAAATQAASSVSVSRLITGQVPFRAITISAYLAQRGELDVTQWLAWFLGILDRALDSAELILGRVFHQALVWQRASEHSLNDRQRKVIARLLDHFKGHLTSSKYAKIGACSSDTALRDINQLVSHGLLLQNSAGGRSTSYRLAD